MTLSASSLQNPDGLLLCLNGAEEKLQFVLADIAEPAIPRVFQQWTAPGKTMQLLAPALDAAVRQIDASTADIRRLACVRGPGSFTGLRVAMATAMGLAAATGADVAGLEYLPLLARRPAAVARTLGVGGAVWVLVHARRAQVYLQGFCVDQEAPEPLGPAEAVSVDAAVTRILSGPRPCVACGSGLVRNPAALAEPLLRQSVSLLPSVFNTPDADSLLQAAAGAAYGQEPVDPLYLCASDAEENLDAIAASRGLDPGAARRRLEHLRRL